MKLGKKWWIETKTKIMKFQIHKSVIEAHGVFSIRGVQKILK